MPFIRFVSRRPRRGATLRGWFCLLLAAATLITFPSEEPNAAGGLRVAPTRVVFEGRARSAHVTLINGGSTTTTYRIAFRHVRMTETGEFEEVDPETAGLRWADAFIRYAPRQVTIRPGETQTIRLLLRKPHGLPDGEYHSRLVFIALPSGDQDVPDEESRRSDIAIELRAVYGVSIPVIVRQGQLSATVRLSAPRLVATPDGPTPAALRVRIDRAGDRSVYGDLEAVYEPVGAPPRSIGRMRGVAVYDSLAARHVALPLNEMPGMGRLRIVFRAQPDDGGAILAEQALPIP
jgi:P pilus assembly chaperone PapD